MIPLPNLSAPFSPRSAGKQQPQILFRGSPVVNCVCLVVTFLVGHPWGLKGTKLDHRDTRRECYLTVGLIDKLPLHFISQTDWA